MIIEDIFESYPQRAEKLAHILMQFGLQCVGCHVATTETLEAGIIGHGIQDQLDEILKALNDEISRPLDTISLMPLAAQKFKDFCKSENKDGFGLRFGEVESSCCQRQYVLDFEEKATLNDRTFHSNGISIFVKQNLVKQLLGSEIDYIEELNNTGFKVFNPNSKSSCKCKGHE